jgi:cell wall-associated NlpC family hydrolase
MNRAMSSILGAVSRRTVGLGVAIGIVLAGGAGWAAVGREEASSASAPKVRASIEHWRWAPDNELPRRADDEADAEPADDAATAGTATGDAEPAEDPEPTAPATSTDEPAEIPELPSLGEGGDDVLVKAEVLDNGVALPPLEAPPEVRAIFEAGNTIARSPYKWGGGHGKWKDNGYDCSGSVSYALAAAGLLDRPLASGPLMRWGKPGKGKWITIYSNPGHVFMVVAGVRFDTVARGQTGSRWINSMTDTSGYVARHPPGL